LFVGELSPARKNAVLAICCLSLVIVSMDSTIVNVALPSIRASLHSTLSGLQWIIDAYTLVLGSLLLLSGSTADRLGRRRVFQTGLVMFSLGSLLCSVATSTEALIAYRMIQAVGGSMLNPVAMAIITNVFVEPRQRARAIGVWGAVVGIGLAVGPVVGGLLSETVGWRSIFWINVPIGALALVLAGLFVPESRAHHARRVDPVGQVLVILVLAGVIYAIIEGHRAGWASAEILLSFGLAGASLGALLWYEPRRVDPLIELGFFRSVPFTGATVAAVCAFGAFGAFLFLNTLYLQDVRHLSAVRAGVETVPMALLTSVCAPLSGRLVAGYGARPPLLVAGCGMCASALLMTRLGLQTSTGYLLLGYVVFGIGFGMVNAPITNTAVSGMPRAQAGVAAAVASTSRQVGLSLGVAVAGSLLGPVAAASSGERFVLSARPAWWVIAGAAAVVAVVGLLSTSAAAQRTAYAAPSAADQPGQVPGGSGAIAH
jgi:EmrB/QacA subfamily drug resistance transporter